jgi:hypothetical protein
MAAPASTTPETLITLKVNYDGNTRRFKLPLRELGANSLELKVCYDIVNPVHEPALSLDFASLSPALPDFSLVCTISPNSPRFCVHMLTLPFSTASRVPEHSTRNSLHHRAVLGLCCVIYHP